LYRRLLKVLAPCVLLMFVGAYSVNAGEGPLVKAGDQYQWRRTIQDDDPKWHLDLQLRALSQELIRLRNEVERERTERRLEELRDSLDTPITD
jgi:hypothetical protein